MRVNISNIIKKHLVRIGYGLESNSIENEGYLILEAVCYALYALISIVLICINEAETVVMCLNLICLLQVVLHNIIHASELSKGLEELNRKHRIFNYYHLKITIIITVILSLAAATTIVAIPLQSFGKMIKIVSIFAIVIIFIDNCEELVICGYSASIVKR